MISVPKQQLDQEHNHVTVRHPGLAGYPTGEGLTLVQACRCVVGEVLPLLRDLSCVSVVKGTSCPAMTLQTSPNSSSDDPRKAEVAMAVIDRTLTKVLQYHGDSVVVDPMLCHIVILCVSFLELDTLLRSARAAAAIDWCYQSHA